MHGWRALWCGVAVLLLLLQLPPVAECSSFTAEPRNEPYMLTAGTFSNTSMSLKKHQPETTCRQSERVDTLRRARINAQRQPLQAQVAARARWGQQRTQVRSMNLLGLQSKPTRHVCRIISEDARVAQSAAGAYELDTASSSGAYHLRINNVSYERDNGKFYCQLSKPDLDIEDAAATVVVLGSCPVFRTLDFVRIEMHKTITLIEISSF